MTHDTILVTGATGTVGNALVGLLASSRPEIRLRVLSRRDTLELPPGVDHRRGDFEEPDSVQNALTGCTRLFLLSTGQHLAAHDAVAAAAAVRSGVQGIVKLSVLGVSHDAQDPITQWHRAGEQAIRATGIPSTMLRPTGFMSNALNWAWSIATTGTVAAPYPHGRTALIDPADIARVAAVALTDSPTDAAYDLTGPQPLTPGEQVQIIGDVIGRNLTYVPEEPESTRATLERFGMPPQLARAVVALFASSEEPWNAAPLPTVKEVTGQAPSTFRSWTQRNRISLTQPSSW